MPVALRPRDLVRRGAFLPGQPQAQPCNLHHAGWPQYHWAWTRNGNLFYERADFSVPPAVVETQVTTNGLSAWPHLARDTRARLWLIWQEGVPGTEGVRRAFSDDDGATWSSPETVFTNGKYPRIAIHPRRGVMILAAWVGNRIRARRQFSGETTLGAEYTFTEVGGGEIVVEDEGFDLSPAVEGPGRWILIARRQGQTQLTHWASADDGLTWEALS